jgi:hypothetical protein
MGRGGLGTLILWGHSIMQFLSISWQYHIGLFSCNGGTAGIALASTSERATMGLADPLLDVEGRQWLLNSLFEAAPEKIQEHSNIQLLNLLCADCLPGNEDIDIRGCLTRLDKLIDYIRGSIERTYQAYGPAEFYGYCKYKTIMGIIVARLKLEYGACYSPIAKADLEEVGIHAPFDDASEVFINGMLGDDRNHRWGMCTSIPVLVTAIARKLGYPVRLAVCRNHVYCRWEDERACFNIEASNPAGMVCESDEYYRKFRDGVSPEHAKTGYHFRSLPPAEEFASFMVHRVQVLRDAARYDETFLWSAKALQFAPDNTTFVDAALHIAELAIKQRLWKKYPQMQLPETANEEMYEKLGEVLQLDSRLSQWT